MILVDTSVWIDFFAMRSTAQVKSLRALLEKEESLCTCGMVLTEVLQGIRRDEEYRRTREYFQPLVFLPMSRETFILAADIFRFLRRRGITIRNSVDCVIAAVAKEQSVPLLHHDRDFDPLERYCGLKVFRIERSGRT
jgi:hypothetical protein